MKRSLFAFTVLAALLLAGCGNTERRLADITSEDGYRITQQQAADITLAVPMDALPDDIWQEDGHTFAPEEVVAYRTDTTTVYLDYVMPSNEDDEKLYIALACAYDLPESGTILLPYKVKDSSANITSGEVNAASRDVTADGTVYPDAVSLRGQGPGEKFAFYLSADVCRQAEGTLEIQVSCNELTYEAAD